MPQGKLFYIKSQLNGLVLGVQGAKSEPGTPVITRSKTEDCDSLLWYEDHLEGTLRCKLNGLCLDLNDSDELIIADFQSGRDNQQWLTAGDRVQNRADSSKVLDISDQNEEEGATVISAQANDGLHQKWSIEFTDARYFYIKSKMHGKVLDIKKRDLTTASKVVIAELDKGGPDVCQLWYENKYGVILNKANMFVMDGSDGKIRLQPYDPGNTNQLWTIQGDRVVNRVQPNQVLNIKGQHKKIGAKINSHVWNGNDNQRWEFIYA